jgi:phenylalanyl-tRNA synthetase beta chain
MKVTFKWLQDYIQLDGISPEQLAEALTNRGIPVETIEYRNPGIEGVVVGEVLEVNPHPNADRLRVCKVDAGTGELLHIVCGAPNVQAGQKVPVALIGAKLPELEIKRAKLRGVESQGMLCSANEIGLNVKLLPKEQTEGLFILPDDAPVGESIVSYLELDDVVLDLELTPNRSDCLSYRGVAYEVGAIFGREVTMPTVPPTDAKQAASLSVKIESPNCTYYAGQVMEGLTVKPSPMWMQMRLLSVGIRPINNIVDITNYVMLEYGQPLHAFDLTAIADQTIVVRQAAEGETLVTLDGQTRQLDPSMLVIADAQKAIGLAGVMGGENSEVRSETQNIVLESAAFDPGVVRSASKAFGLRSEAATRFEKGVDPAIVDAALQRATALLVEYAGATPVGTPVTAGKMDAQPKRISLSVENVNKVLGMDIPKQTVRDIFQALGLAVVEQTDDRMTVEVPTRRSDLNLPVDLIEEVARMHGYDKIPTTFPTSTMAPGGWNEEQTLRRVIRDTLIGLGFQEVFTYSFVSPEALEKLGHSADESGTPIRLQLPLSEERSVLRTRLLPSLLEVVQYNINRKSTDLRLFEIGKTYITTNQKSTWNGGQTLPDERYQVAAILTGKKNDGRLGKATEPYDFFDLKGALETLLESVGVEGVRFMADSTVSYLHPTQTARLEISEKTIGWVGALHPELEQRFDVPRVYYFELDLQTLQEVRQKTVSFVPLPKYPAIIRDIALIVERTQHVEPLLQLIRSAGTPLVRSVNVFDVYEGEQVQPGKKSVAISIEYRADDRTLTDAEVLEIHQTLLDRLASEYHAELRAY